MTSLDLQCISTSAFVSGNALELAHWRAFGYRERPKRGRFFNRFVPAAKFERETFLLREFWAASFSRVFLWASKRGDFRYRIEFIARLMDLCIDGLNEPLWPSLRFTSEQDAARYLADACRSYGSPGLSGYSEVFIERCSTYLNQEMSNIWLIGAYWLFNNSDSLITAIGPALDATGVAENPDSDLEVRKHQYTELAGELFRA